MPECTSCRGSSETGACPYCRKRLKKMLRELVAFIDLLNTSPSLRQQVSSQQEGRGSLSHSLVINVQIVDLISKTGIPAVLTAWSEYVIAERSLDPSSINATKEETRLHKMRNLLSTHNDYLAESELWHDYYYEIKEPWKVLSRIIHGERKPPKPVQCPVQDCVGYLQLESNGDVHCLKDNTHKWIYDEWSRLALLIAG
jgi:hypothetical protein